MINYFRSLNIKFNEANFNGLRTNSRIIIMILVVACSLVGKSPASVLAAGTTYYVDNTNKSCSDIGSGTTVALPFCKIAKGASAAAAGDTVWVLAGSYAETVTVPKSGSIGLPITYSAAPGVTVAGNGLASGGNAFRISSKSYITINGFTITGTADRGIYVSGSNNITVTNNRVSYSGKPVSGSTRAGIYFTGTTNSTISGNSIDHNTYHGIHLTTGSKNNLVSNNLTFGNAQQWQRDASGIRLDGNGTTSNTILHNISYGNEDSGITNYTGASGNFEISNLLYGNGDHGIDDLNSPNNVIIGNTVQGNVTTGINFEGTSSPGSGGATVINNIMVDNGLRKQVGGGTSAGQPSNIRFDSTSLVGDTFDYNIYYLTSSGAQIQWKGTNYSTLEVFKAAVPGQEVHGLQTNPFFIAPAPVAQRPASAPYTVAVNVGNYHIQAGSPAIDSAYADAPNEPLRDLDGTTRVDDPNTLNTGAGVRIYDDRGVYEFQPSGGVSTFTPTNTAIPPTPTFTFTPTNTSLPPTATFTPTNTLVPPTPTFTFTPTKTSLPPTATFTPINTLVPPTPTFTFTPTKTSLPPTATFTPTNTPIPPTPTNTSLPPTATFTPTPGSGSGSTLTFTANADSYVNQTSPNSNSGTNVQLWVDGDVGATYKSNLKFSVIGVTGTVQRATLRVYATSGTVGGPTVYATTNSWTETGITWNTQPAVTSSGLDVKGAVSTGVWVEYNVTLVVTGDGTYSFVLVPTSTDGVSFSSRENSQPPQLVLTIGP
jgi:parallel beta-helix repeat protein